jgi:imidazoleglycerol phosphate dehydratase HisB
MERVDYTALYAENEDFKRYVDRYCTKHRVSVDEALQHCLVQMAGRMYKEQEETIVR